MNILRKKDYKLDYSNDIINIVNTMAINKKYIRIVGSMALKSMPYASDYDCFEILQNTNYKSITKQFQANINKLLLMNNVFVGDVKIGQIYNDSVRWSIKEILQGYQVIKNKSFTLQDGFASNGMNKLDLVVFVSGVYKDFSTVYQFKTNYTDVIKTIADGLKEDIKELYKNNNYYKSCKRMFSLAKLNNWNSDLELFYPLFIGDLGIINMVSSDIGTLIYLIENHKHINKSKMDYEIDNFKNRLSNVYENNSFLQKEKTIILLINKSEIENNNLNDLFKIQNILNTIIQNTTKKYLTKINFNSIKQKYFN